MLHRLGRRYKRSFFYLRTVTSTEIFSAFPCVFVHTNIAVGLAVETRTFGRQDLGNHAWHDLATVIVVIPDDIAPRYIGRQVE